MENITDTYFFLNNFNSPFQLAQCRCDDTAEQIRQLLGPEPRWPTRRKSAPCQQGGGEAEV